MIAHLKGTVLQSNATSIVLTVANIGYRVFLTENGLTKAHAATKEISLYTYLSVRETALDLYGFFEQDELYFFEMLISVSGIGPKSALSILSIADIETLQNAILENNSSYLTKVSGIGTKNAQKIVLELQGKIDRTTSVRVLDNDVDVLEALTSLGYSAPEARKVIREIPDDVEETNARIKHALKLLGK